LRTERGQQVNARAPIPVNLVPIETVYAVRCNARASLFINGALSLHEAVDELQAYAEQSGLVDRIGQDEAQRIMSVAFAAVDLLPDADAEPAPIEIDAGPCEHCGCTIDRHRRVDTDKGPKFFCDDLEALIHLRAAELVKRWELADPRVRWKHTGEAPPKAVSVPKARPEPYCTPQSTLDAFWYVASLGNSDHLAQWLAKHPTDAPELLKIWKGKRC
jgi:hypothetical protein